MANSTQEDYIAELEYENRQLRQRIAQLEQARNYYPGYPAPGPRQKEITE